jgi:hypothetical protein
MTPALVPCSRNAHDQNVLVRRPQWDQRGCHSQKEETSKIGGSMYIVRCAQERAASATPLKGEGNKEVLAERGRLLVFPASASLYSDA